MLLQSGWQGWCFIPIIIFRSRGSLESCVSVPLASPVCLKSWFLMQWDWKQPNTCFSSWWTWLGSLCPLSSQVCPRQTDSWILQSGWLKWQGDQPTISRSSRPVGLARDCNLAGWSGKEISWQYPDLVDLLVLLEIAIWLAVVARRSADNIKI